MTESKRKSRTQPLEAIGGAVEPAVMAHARRGPHLHAGLIRIEFPGMRVKRHGLALEAVDPIDAPLGPRIRELPEVAAAADRQVDATEPDRRSRHLQQ